MNLKAASVIGYFSLPSASLAEHNPSAYNAAMAGAPENAGTCAHCGTGIRHHVVVSVDNRTALIGTDCAARIGGDVARCAGAKLTSAQVAERDARNAEWHAEYFAEQEFAKAERDARLTEFAKVLACLKSQDTDFHRSLAEQLSDRSLSDRQSFFALKAIFGRRNKKNGAEWDALADKLQGVEQVA